MEKRTILPCYKYISRNITDESMKHRYAKNYMANMVKNGVDQSEARLLYCATGLSSEAGEMFSVNGVTLKESDYFDYIIGEESIVTTSCQSFYKEIIKVTQKNNLCLTCPVYKNYANGRYDEECALFKYIITDKANLDAVVSLGLPLIFKSIVDVGSELDTPVPALVPILDIAYAQLLDMGAVFANAEIAERLNMLVGKISAASAKYNVEVKKLLEKNHKAMPVVWSIVSSDIVSAKDMTYEEVCQLLSKIDLENNHRQQKKKKKKKTDEPLPLFDLIDSGTLNTETAVNEFEQGDVPYIPAPDDIPDIALSYEEHPDESVVDDGDGPSYSDSDVLAQADDRTEGSLVVMMPDIDGVPDSSIMDGEPGVEVVESPESELAEPETAEKPGSVSEVIEPQCTAADSVPSATDTNKPPAQKVVRYRIPPIDDTSCIYLAEVPRRALKSYAAPYKEHENDVFECVRKSKRLPIEIVCDNGLAYALMFVRALGAFYYCAIDSELPSTLLVCLQSPKIIKICYQPYFLYSLFRLYDCSLSSVYSICTMDMLLNPKASVCIYHDYFRVFDANFPIEGAPSTGYVELDDILLNMQRYIQIEAFQTRSKFDANEFARRQRRDEVLGSSFLRNRNLMTNDLLFDLEPSGRIEFNQSFDLSARVDGFFVTYSLGIDSGSDIKVENVYLGALYDLCRKGRFKKYNIQLITISSGAMVLFVGENEYDLITTALQKYFNVYALKNNYERFELNASHQRIYVTQKNTNRPALPTTYDDAMDMLMTTNDSVEVSDSHIVTRKRAAQKKRKRQQKKFMP